MRINTNIASMTAQENASNVNKNLSSSLEKLSSGLRINKASDDASGMSIADKLRTQASSLGQSISNANSANALVQIADKAMAEQSNILDIVKTKLIQAATETTSAEGREAIRKDVSKLLEQLDNISTQTNYNGINLLDTKGQQFKFQVGEKAEYGITLETAYAVNTDGLGGGSTSFANGVELDASEGTLVKLSGNSDTQIAINTVASDGNSTGEVSFLGRVVAGTSSGMSVDEIGAAIVADKDALIADWNANNAGNEIEDITYNAGSNGLAVTFADGTGDVDLMADVQTSGIKMTNTETTPGVATSEVQSFAIANPNGDGFTFLGFDFGSETPADLTATATLLNTAANKEDVINAWNANNPTQEIEDYSVASDGTKVTVTFKASEGDVALLTSAQIGSVTDGSATALLSGSVTQEVAGDNTPEVQTYTLSSQQDVSVNVDAQEATALTLKLGANAGASGSSVTLTTDDTTTKAALDAQVASNNLTKVEEGVYTLSVATGTDSKTLTFASAIDLANLKIDGISTTDSATSNDQETILIKSTGQVQINANDAAKTVTVNSAATDGTIASSDAGELLGGELLSALKNLEVDGLTSDVANQFMGAIDEALNQVNTVRSDFGSTQNQLDSFVRNAMTTQTNIKAAESVIRDVDYAAESANFNKQNIIAQAGTYAMSQANAIQQNVMRLLQ